MIALSTEVQDVIGDRVFPDADRYKNLNESGSRRCTRTATLDGGCEVYDTGYSDSDRIAVINDENATQEMIDYVKYLIQNYSSIVVALKDGVFRGVPSEFTADNGLNFKILITERISE
jgi:hypothetical protein